LGTAINSICSGDLKTSAFTELLLTYSLPRLLQNMI
jgi:hypothetical protein